MLTARAGDIGERSCQLPPTEVSVLGSARRRRAVHEGLIHARDTSPESLAVVDICRVGGCIGRSRRDSLSMCSCTYADAAACCEPLCRSRASPANVAQPRVDTP
jgi:hypothetical protein